MSIYENNGSDRSEWWNKSPESLIRAARFSDETAKAIETYGGKVFTVSGVSIAEQSRTKPGLILDDTDDPQVRNLSVPACQLAVFPHTPFVPDSFGKEYYEQVDLLAADTDLLATDIGNSGFRLVMPEAPVVTEIFLKHLLASDNNLNPLYGRRRTTRTGTPVRTKRRQESTATVGYFQHAKGLLAYRASKGYGSPEGGLLRVAAPHKAT